MKDSYDPHKKSNYYYDAKDSDIFEKIISTYGLENQIENRVISEVNKKSSCFK